MSFGSVLQNKPVREIQSTWVARRPSPISWLGWRRVHFLSLAENENVRFWKVYRLILINNFSISDTSLPLPSACIFKAPCCLCNCAASPCLQNSQRSKYSHRPVSLSSNGSQTRPFFQLDIRLRFTKPYVSISGAARGAVNRPFLETRRSSGLTAWRTSDFLTPYLNLQWVIHHKRFAINRNTTRQRVAVELLPFVTGVRFPHTSCSRSSMQE